MLGKNKDFLETLTFVTLYLFVFPVWSDDYPPMEGQLDSSEAVIHGIYNGQVHRRDKNNKVVTDLRFSLLKSVGIKFSEIINKNDFRVTVPGGKWKGVNYHDSASPQFNKGDEVVLFLSRGEIGFRISNLTVGKYNVLRGDDRELYLRLDNAPDHKVLGKINYFEFDRKVEYAFGSKMKAVKSDIYVSRDGASRRRFGWKKIQDEDIRRGIASLEEKIQQRKTVRGGSAESISTFKYFVWSILILGALFAFSQYIVNKRGK